MSCTACKMIKFNKIQLFYGLYDPSLIRIVGNKTENGNLKKKTKRKHRARLARMANIDKTVDVVNREC